MFQPTQTKSALKNFAIQNQIKGSNGYDPESFLLISKQPVTNLVTNTRLTKVKLILSCMMEKEVNLESTNSNELFSKMKENSLGILRTISKDKEVNGDSVQFRVWIFTQ